MGSEVKEIMVKKNGTNETKQKGGGVRLLHQMVREPAFWVV